MIIPIKLTMNMATGIAAPPPEDMMTTVVCVDCGQADSKDRMLKAPRGFVHIFNKYCEKAWQARAEAAEQRVVEQQVVINMLMSESHPLDPIIRRHERDYAEQQKAYFASLDRIIELEAQLAAQAWRPLTEPPKEAGEYLGWEADGARRLIIVTYDPDLDYEDSWAWSDWYDEATPITHWRPLPAPPIDPPAPA